MTEEIDLIKTTDAKVWTDEFLKINPNTGLDFGTMIGWFANAIMTGSDHTRWKMEKEIGELKNIIKDMGAEDVLKEKMV
jgi:hypothetical protein